MANEAARLRSAKNRRVTSADSYAAPMVGAVISSILPILVAIAATYTLVKEWELRRAG